MERQYLSHFQSARGITGSCEPIPEPSFPAILLFLPGMIKRVRQSPVSNSSEFGSPGSRQGPARPSRSPRRDARGSVQQGLRSRWVELRLPSVRKLRLAWMLWLPKSWMAGASIWETIFVRMECHDFDCWAKTYTVQKPANLDVCACLEGKVSLDTVITRGHKYDDSVIRVSLKNIFRKSRSRGDCYFLSLRIFFILCFFYPVFWNWIKKLQVCAARRTNPLFSVSKLDISIGYHKICKDICCEILGI